MAPGVSPTGRTGRDRRRADTQRLSRRGAGRARCRMNSQHGPLLIGVSARIYTPGTPGIHISGIWTKNIHYLEQSVAHWVLSGHAMAVMIPAVTKGSIVTRTDLNLRHYAQALDGLVLQGGNDVAPETYHEQALAPEWGGDRVRDLYEIEL